MAPGPHDLAANMCMFELAASLTILRLFVLGNGIHVPMVAAWFHYVLSRCVKRSSFFQLGPTLCGAAGKSRDDVFEDFELF